MYVGHTNALTAVLVILPARWAGVALQPLSVPFGPAGITHACRHNLDVPEGYIYKANTCAGPQKRCGFRSRYLHGTSSSRFERRARAGKKGYPGFTPLYNRRSGNATGMQKIKLATS